MSKQSNTAIFIVIATVVNIIIMIALFLIVFIGASLLFNLEGGAAAIVLGLSFIVSIAGSIFIYSKLVRWSIEKFNLEDKLIPLFAKKKRR